MLAELNEVPTYDEMHQGIGEHPCDVVDVRGRFLSPCFSAFGVSICKSVESQVRQRDDIAQYWDMVRHGQDWQVATEKAMSGI